MTFILHEMWVKDIQMLINKILLKRLTEIDFRYGFVWPRDRQGAEHVGLVHPVKLKLIEFISFY